MDLTFKSVTKSYGLITAVKDVSFSVNQGDFVILTGPSGAGKTTIFKIILGEIQPSSGNIIIDKQDISSLSKKDMDQLRRKIGVIFQDYQLIFDKTVEENIALALDIIYGRQEDSISQIENVLKTVGLLNRRFLFPSQLSGGELQRVALARALVVKPKLILADEPMGNLDQQNSLKLIELFERINKDSQTTIILATHNPHLITKLNLPLIEIDNGKITSKLLVSTKKVKKIKKKKNKDTKH